MPSDADSFLGISPDRENDSQQSTRSEIPWPVKLLGIVGILVICILGIFLWGAISKSGREQVARNALSERIQRESNGLMRLAAFEKTNGIEIEFAGVKYYKIEYVATIEAVDDCLWSLGGSYWDGTFTTVRGQPRKGIEAFNPQVFGKQPAKKGQLQRVTGETGLQKAENGWRVAQLP